MKKIGLVLEGGGMRGLYTSGVLDFFIDNNIYFSYIIGVSTGACNAISYILKQKEKSKDINANYVRDKKYISFKNLIKDKELFETKFLFEDISNKLCPFDYNAFYNSKETVVVCTTNCNTGKPMYFYKNKSDKFFEAIKASMSLPFVNKIVNLNGYPLLDGGITDAIPIKKSIFDGNSKNVIILTRHRGYRKNPTEIKKIADKFYPQYPKLIEALCNRHIMYNKTLEYIRMLERIGKVFIIAPSEPLKVNKIDRNPKKLADLYKKGYKDAEKIYFKLSQWLKKQIELLS
ncbi:patatin-like phospholipase family protein [Defluviitalea phaphyphila]|uniref:patatin-like phospholipase family protein n=1 Tax=Defluviitalea phaphyphila TaxID=1473580 RepID=UPI0007314C1C|nr:patatin family protein [Defluviitalea phaphyphila]